MTSDRICLLTCFFIWTFELSCIFSYSIICSSNKIPEAKYYMKKDSLFGLIFKANSPGQWLDGFNW